MNDKIEDGLENAGKKGASLYAEGRDAVENQVENAADAGASLKDKAKKTAARAQDSARELGADASAKGRQAANYVSRNAEAQPLLAALAVGALGFVLGIAAARRS